jgi:hypothetical protein
VRFVRSDRRALVPTTPVKKRLGRNYRAHYDADPSPGRLRLGPITRSTGHWFRPCPYTSANANRALMKQDRRPGRADRPPIIMRTRKPPNGPRRRPSAIVCSSQDRVLSQAGRYQRPLSAITHRCMALRRANLRLMCKGPQTSTFEISSGPSMPAGGPHRRTTP